MHTFSRLALILALFGPAVTAAQEAEQPEKYLLLATNRTGTMQGELNEDPLEYELVAMTVFRSTFGGSEAAAILESENTNDKP